MFLKKFSKISLAVLLVFSILFQSAVSIVEGTPENSAEPADASEELTPDNLLMPFDVDARAAILLEPETGTVIYAKNPDEPLPPASITKMMTLLLAFEALEEGRVGRDDIIIVSERAWRKGGSQMFLEVNREVTLWDLLTGISVVSANDACIAVAEHLTGSEEHFVQLMNERAAALGMTATRFKNSTGWPAADHYMSARDIAILAKQIVLHHPDLVELEAKPEFTFNDIRQFNRNPLLGRFPGADGLKTGWTTEAGYSLAGTAVQNEMRLISVVLNTPDEGARSRISKKLLNYGFRNFTLQEVVSAGSPLGEISLEKGRKRELPVNAANSLQAIFPINQEDQLEITKNIAATPVAPVAEGDIMGTVQVLLDGKILAEGNLVAGEDIDKANILVRIFRAIGDFLRGLF